MNGGCSWRVTKSLAALLLVGVLINVLVAWGAVLWAPFPRPIRAQAGQWQRSVPASWPSVPTVDVLGRTAWITATESATVDMTGVVVNQSFSQSAVQAGWPLRSMSHDILVWEGGGAGPFQVMRTSVKAPRWIPTLDQRWERARLPLRPTMPGFLINSVLYAVVTCGAVLGAWHLRRSMRVRRGCCTRCGYDLAGLLEGTQCPECGPGMAGATHSHALGAH